MFYALESFGVQPQVLQDALNKVHQWLSVGDDEASPSSDDCNFPPWAPTNADEQHYADEIRQRCLQLSNDESLFLLDTWDAEAAQDAAQCPSAAAALANDPQLRQLRFRLVPKHLSENLFWARYFAAVTRIKRDVVQSVEMSGAFNNTSTLGANAVPNQGSGRHPMSPTWCSSAASCASILPHNDGAVHQAMPSHYARSEGAVMMMQPALDDDGWLLL